MGIPRFSPVLPGSLRPFRAALLAGEPIPINFVQVCAVLSHFRQIHTIFGQFWARVTRFVPCAPFRSISCSLHRAASCRPTVHHIGQFWASLTILTRCGTFRSLFVSKAGRRCPRQLGLALLPRCAGKTDLRPQLPSHEAQCALALARPLATQASSWRSVLA